MSITPRISIIRGATKPPMPPATNVPQPPVPRLMPNVTPIPPAPTPPPMRTGDMLSHAPSTQPTPATINLEKNVQIPEQATLEPAPIEPQLNRQQFEEISMRKIFGEDSEPLPHVESPPAPVPPPEPMIPHTFSQIRVQDSAKQQKKDAAESGRSAGTSISDTFIADPLVPIDEWAVSSDLMLKIYNEPASPLHRIIKPAVDHFLAEGGQDPSVMASATEAENAIRTIFGHEPIPMLVEKSPVSEEASAQAIYISIYPGSGGIRVNPLLANSFTADFDGDAGKVIFNPDMTRMAKSPMQHMIGTDGQSKIDPDIFNRVRWEPEEYVNQMKRILTSHDVPLTNINTKPYTDAMKLSLTDPNAGFSSLINWLQEVGRQNPSNPRLPAQILTELYHINHQIAQRTILLTNWFNKPMPTPARTVHSDPVSGPWDADITPGTKPTNYLDYWHSIGVPTGKVEGKAVHMRAGTADSKTIHKHLGMHVGTYIENMPDTARDHIVKGLSGAIDYSPGAHKTSSLAAQNVIEKIGLPKNAPDIRLWMQDFIDAWNHEVFISKQSLLDIKLDQTISQHFDALSELQVSLHANTTFEQKKQLTTQIGKVYGKFTVKHAFGDIGIPGFQDELVSDFIHQNRIHNPLGTKSDKDNPPIDSMHQLGKYLANGRNSHAVTYNNEFLTALDNLIDKGQLRVTRLTNLTKKNPAHIGDLVDAFNTLYRTHPDVFEWHGWNNLTRFLEDPRADKIRTAKNPDKLGGAIYSAIGTFRVDPILRAYEGLEAADNWLDAYHANLEFEARLDEVRSSSDTWAAIIHDWEMGGTLLNDIVLSDKLGKQAKDTALNKAQKNRHPGFTHEAYTWQLPNAIASELMANPQGLYSGNRWLGDFGKNKLLDNIRVTNKALNNYNRTNTEKITKQVVAAKLIDNADVYLDYLLTDVKNNPANLYQVMPDHIIDAALYVMDPEFAISEKAKSGDVLSLAFASASYARFGRLVSDAVYADDVAMGVMHVDDFIRTPMEMAKLLSNPNYRIHLYDDLNPMGKTYSREEIIGSKPTYNQIWNWLQKNPRAAMCLRSHTTSGYGNGKHMSIATRNLPDTLQSDYSPENAARQLLVDNTGYRAALAMTVRMSGKKKIQARGELVENEPILLDTLRWAAAHPNPGAFIELYLAYPTSQATKKLKGRILHDTVGPNGIIDDLTTRLTNYAWKLKEKGLILNEKPKKLTTFHFDDPKTALSYWSGLANLDNAKTEIDTAINGATSDRFNTLTYLANIIEPVPCEAPPPELVPVYEFMFDWHKYAGHKIHGTNIPVTEMRIDKIIAQHPEGIPIEDPAMCTSSFPCIRHAMFDPSSNMNPSTQTTALGRLNSIVRSKSAEHLNLKSTTRGGDELDSFTKKPELEPFEQTRAMIEETFETSGLPATRVAMATWLQSTYQKMGYDDLSLSDFVNIAQLMVRIQHAPEGDPKLLVMSLGQLNALCRNACQQLVNTSTGQLSNQDFMTAIKQAMETVEVEPNIDILGAINRIQISQQQNFRVGTIDHMQSAHPRNDQVMRKLMETPGAITATEANINQTVKVLYDRLPNTYQEKLAKWIGYRNIDKPKIINRQYAYNLLGITDKNGATLSRIPGTRTAYVITDSASLDAVKSTLQLGEQLGTTIFIPKMTPTIEQAIADVGHANNTVRLDNGVYTIPFFDILLNGPNTSGQLGSYNVGVTTAHPDNFATMVVVPPSFLQFGDADAIATTNLTNRVQPTKRGEYLAPVNTMFANFRKDNPHTYPHIQKLSKERIQYLIEAQGFNVDPGRFLSTYDQVKYEAAIDRYFNRFDDEANENGWLLNNLRPGDVIGVVEALVDGDIAHHFVQVFPDDNKSGAPRTLNIANPIFRKSENTLVIPWEHKGKLEGNYFKFQQGLFEGNKMICSPDVMEAPLMQDGNAVDVFVGESTVASRLIGGIRENLLMYSLMHVARNEPYGYNLAELPNTLLTNGTNVPSQLRDGLLTGELRLGDWIEYIDTQGHPIYVADNPTINAFIQKLVEDSISAGVNPSLVLASRYGDSKHGHIFDYRILFDNSPSYVNNFLKFHHMLNPTLCPNGVLDIESGPTLFNAMMQRQVPMKLDNGETRWFWFDAFTAIPNLTKEYAGFKSPGTLGKGFSPSSQNTLAYGGGLPLPQNINAFLSYGGVDTMDRSMSPLWMLPEDD